MYAAIDAVMTKIIMEKLSAKWSNIKGTTAGAGFWWVGGPCQGCEEGPPSPLRARAARSLRHSNYPSPLRSSDEEEEDVEGGFSAGAFSVAAPVAGRVGVRFEPLRIGIRALHEPALL